MLTSVEVRTAQGTLLTLPLLDVYNGLIVEEITGLDPVKATIVTSTFANLDGAQYQSSRREPRNITMRIGLEPDYATDTVEDLRRRLYAYLMPTSSVSLRFIMSDGLELDIQGRVESFEAPLFVKEPAVDISIVCFDPDFYDATPVTISGTSVSTTTETLLTYPGTVPSGLLLTLSPNRSVSEFDIYHRPPDAILRTMYLYYALIYADVVKINSVRGAKYASLTRASTTIPFVFALSPVSSWFQLMPGDNYIRVYATGAGIPYTIQYTKRYGGL